MNSLRQCYDKQQGHRRMGCPGKLHHRWNLQDVRAILNTEQYPLDNQDVGCPMYGLSQATVNIVGQLQHFQC